MNDIVTTILHHTTTIQNKLNNSISTISEHPMQNGNTLFNTIYGVSMQQKSGKVNMFLLVTREYGNNFCILSGVINLFAYFILKPDLFRHNFCFNNVITQIYNLTNNPQFQSIWSTFSTMTFYWYYFYFTLNLCTKLVYWHC